MHLSTFTIIIVCAAVVGAWAMLTVIGGERQRRVMELEAEMAARRAAKASPPPDDIPVLR